MEMESNLANAYNEAYRLASAKLLTCDFEELSSNSKTIYDKKSSRIIVRYLCKNYAVDCTTGSVNIMEEGGKVTITEKVLILHYLLTAKQRPLTGKQISFLEVPQGGAIYYNTFKKRAIDPLVKKFSDDIYGLKQIANMLSGKIEPFGSAAVKIDIFPMVPVIYVIWQGDEEILPSGTILFDSSVSDFLPTEDIVLAASFGVYKMLDLSHTALSRLSL